MGKEYRWEQQAKPSAQGVIQTRVANWLACCIGVTAVTV
jgi:hypothetical protein